MATPRQKSHAIWYYSLWCCVTFFLGNFVYGKVCSMRRRGHYVSDTRAWGALIVMHLSPLFGYLVLRMCLACKAKIPLWACRLLGFGVFVAMFLVGEVILVL